MPIVDGRYEAKIGTTYKIEKGIEEVKRKIKRSRVVRISNIPMNLLKELMPLLEGKDLKIILPMGVERTEELTKLGEVAVTKARLYHQYDEEEANIGNVSFSDVIFNISWTDDRIIEISTMEYSKCVKCMRRTFDTAWRYAQK
jgi:predicted transcriptional regulator